MAELKTKQTDESVDAFLNSIPDEKKRQDSLAVLKLMQEVTGEVPKMWGDSIVGFGNYHYVYASGREGDVGKVGFSPRKESLTLYFGSGFDQDQDLLAKLGRHKVGKGCLYIKKLEDVDQGVLRSLVERAMQHFADMGQ